MAKPRIFISSTFYDLKQIRSDLDSFIQTLGYESIRNEEGNIPYGKDEALEEYCYKEIKNVDILISIIGGRYGNEGKIKNNSISQIELETAYKEDKQVYIFIEKNVLSEYETYLYNKDNDIKYRYVDDKKIYEFIEKLKAKEKNNNIKSFESSSDISKYLKEQFAGLFRNFLEQQTRNKEIKLIEKLENNISNLDKLATFLNEANKDKSEEVNKIISINHPLIEALKERLLIEYNFYIEGIEDLKKLLKDKHYYEGSDIDFDYLVFTGTNPTHKYTIKISRNLFDKEKKLRYIKKTDWDRNYLIYESTLISNNDDVEAIF
ncbi:DUF4062 domain-containing protein [Psychrilyobacter atlanticus]|uniref:DUF4062 domain-containing protein n=1 Tax=Psychrilyobacter atlanticus TaxID=271091 RepID=UPI000408814C|nr:DUF4062 domain-containing protein [Psychrilyobacter atlanticus]